MEGKKGQVTLFVIIALIIVVFGVLIYFFYPGVNSTVSGIEENPRLYMQDCVEENLLENVELISSRGGSIEPSSSYLYGGEPIQYLCYTNEPYKTCTIQKAFLVNHLENEIETSIENKVNDCFTQMENDYQGKGYTLNLVRGELSTTLAPNKIIVLSDSRLTLTKDSTQNYESFDIILNNNLFELASLAGTVVSWEKNYGVADPIYFMSWYKDRFDIKKLSPDGGKTAIWILTDSKTEESFRFAVSETEIPLGA